MLYITILTNLSKIIITYIIYTKTKKVLNILKRTHFMHKTQYFDQVTRID